VAASAFSPLRGAAEAVSEPFTNAWHGVTGYGDLKSENDRLRRTIDELEGREVLQEDAAQQLAELLEQQDLEWVGDIPTTAARVLSGSPSNFSHTVDISKGSADGVTVGMPVVNGAGLVGKVVLATAHRASVQLVTDPDFAVGVKLLGSGVTGTARGQGRGQDLLVDTPLEPDSEQLPKPGTAITTSGAELSSVPDSIPVGKLRSMKESGGGLSLDLIVRPMADTTRLAFLTVLLWEPPT
jgi:rod shape-determining protein MreC